MIIRVLRLVVLLRESPEGRLVRRILEELRVSRATFCLAPTVTPESEVGVAELLPGTAYQRVPGMEPPCFGLFASRAIAEDSMRSQGIDSEFAATAVPARIVRRARRTQPLFVVAAALFEGNATTGATIERIPARDAVVLFYQDTFEFEPSLSRLWVLDGKTGRAHVRAPMSYVVAPDGEHVYLSNEVEVAGYETGPDLETLAERFSTTPYRVSEAIYEDGFVGNSFLVTMSVLDLGTGTDRDLNLLGGGQLLRVGDQILGHRPAGVLVGFLWFPRRGRRDDARAAPAP